MNTTEQFASLREIGMRLREIERITQQSDINVLDEGKVLTQTDLARKALGAAILRLAEQAADEQVTAVAVLPANVTRHPAWMGQG